MSLTARGFIGAGGVQFSLIVAGVLQGYGSARETSKFETKPSTDSKELISKSKENYGQPVETFYTAKPTELTIELLEADYEGLKLAFMGGDGVGINQAAGPVVDEVVTLKLEVYTELSKRNLQAADFSVKNSAGTTTYVLGTDYEVIYLTGMIRPITGGAITNLQSCKVSFTAAAFTSKKLLGSKVSSIRARVLFNGKNLLDDTPILTTVWEAVFTSDNGFDLLADDFGKVQLKGKMITPVGKDSPYELDFLTV